MKDSSTEVAWVGLDVHQDSITAAILHGDDPELEVVRLPGDLNPVRKLFRRLSQQGAAVRGCYEASGAGYVLHRALQHEEVLQDRQQEAPMCGRHGSGEGALRVHLVCSTDSGTGGLGPIKRGSDRKMGNPRFYYAIWPWPNSRH